jgi:hypothetical protein
MKYINSYEKRGIKKDKVFEYLIQTLKPSIKKWDYFVNWRKVKSNAEHLKQELNLLNSLIGSTDLKSEFKALITKYPSVIETIPALLAVRESDLKVLNETMILEDYSFFKGGIKESELERYWNFLNKSGLILLFQDKNIKNFCDYVWGVEVGLDSNGRKNRGGTLMEDAVEIFLKSLINKNKDIEYLSKATPTKIKEKWNIVIKYEKSARSFDFAIYNKNNKKLYLVEANFFNDGGSKLKSVCGEFKSLFTELQKQNIELIWVTDGLGWISTQRPLEETFNLNNHIFNLEMLSKGILDEVVKS